MALQLRFVKWGYLGTLRLWGPTTNAPIKSHKEGNIAERRLNLDVLTMTQMSRVIWQGLSLQLTGTWPTSEWLGIDLQDCEDCGRATSLFFYRLACLTILSQHDSSKKGMRTFRPVSVTRGVCQTFLPTCGICQAVTRLRITLLAVS